MPFLTPIRHFLPVTRPHDGMGDFLRRIGGPEFTWESLAPYQLVDHMDASYPPVYLTANEDDGTVPFSNSLLMEETCQRLGIPHKCRFGKAGGHSFGLGKGLAVEGAGSCSGILAVSALINLWQNSKSGIASISYIH